MDVCTVSLMAALALWQQDGSSQLGSAQAGSAQAGNAQASSTPAASSAAARAGSPYAWFDPIIDLRALLMAGFVDPPDAEAMQQAALDAMARALRDPYTVYVPPTAEGQLRRQLSGSYVGIGVELDLNDNRPVVISTLDDSPAMDAGLLPGDVLLDVDGRSTEGVDALGLEQLLPGEAGTTVRLRVRRADGAERTLDVVRRQIESRSVKGLSREGDGWRYIMDGDRHVGYARIAQFTDRTAAELDAALANMRGHGLSGLILDLRGNGGGSLDAAVQVADRFLAQGGIVSLKGRGDRGRTWDATASPEDVQVPLVILVNQGTASASEVVAGALQDNNRAKIIGARSYGKGSVQEVRALPDGAGMLKMTTARYYLPSGRTVARTPGSSRWGVEPDSGFHVPMTEAQMLANGAARHTWEAAGGGTAGGAAAAQPVAVQWADPAWIRTQASDPQLAAALEAMQGYVDRGEWPVVGDLSGTIGAVNDELRAQLDLRRRLLAELAKTERSITTLRSQGAGVDDPVLGADAVLIDGELVIRDRDGREVARVQIKDPDALRKAMREVGTPAKKAAPEGP